MSARDLAIGLIFGDGGGTVDKTFHEILEHTEIFLEKALDSTYTVKFGMWTQQGFVGNLEAWTYSAIDELYGYNDMDGSPKFCGLLEYNRYTVTPVYIVYKNNVPIYAMPDSGNIPEKFSPEFSTVRYRSGGNIKYAFYVSRDYRVESIVCSGGDMLISTSQVRFNDVMYNVPTRYFEAAGGFVITYSYQNYIDMDGDTEHPYIIPSGSRVTRTSTFTLSSGSQNGIVGQNYDYQNTVFTELSTDELYREFQNVYNAEFTALGFETYPVEILSPSS